MATNRSCANRALIRRTANCSMSVLADAKGIIYAEMANSMSDRILNKMFHDSGVSDAFGYIKV